MNQRQQHQGEIPIPSEVLSDTDATEALRVWISDGRQLIAVADPKWEDPAAWGLLAVDIIRHAAKDYEYYGRGEYEQIVKRIRAGFDAEWDHSTDDE